MAFTIFKLILFVVTPVCLISACVTFFLNISTYSSDDISNNSKRAETGGSTDGSQSTNGIDPDFLSYLWQAFLQMIICWHAITPWIERKAFGGSSGGLPAFFLYVTMFASFVCAWLAFGLYTLFSGDPYIRSTSLTFASTLLSVVAVIFQGWKFNTIAKKSEEQKEKQLRPANLAQACPVCTNLVAQNDVPR